MLSAYRQHAAERAALGIPALPLSAQQVAELIVVSVVRDAIIGDERSGEGEEGYFAWVSYFEHFLGRHCASEECGSQ